MAFYIWIIFLIQLPVSVLGFIDGYILEITPNCGADESSPSTLQVISDLDIFVEVICKDGYFTELNPVSLILYTGTAKFSGDSSNECIFIKKEHSRTYTLRLSVGYGEPGSLFFSYQDEFLITCTYDENTNSDTQQTDIGQGLTAPDEIQRQVSSDAPESSFQLNITDILGNPVTSTVHIGKKIKLVAEMIPSDLNDVKSVLLCENLWQTITCNQGKIRIIEASYGRANITLCQGGLTDDCHAASSYSITSQNCDGKTECVLHASDTIYGDPCFSFQKYLSVVYTCHNEINLCNDDSETLTCDVGTVIEITSASFGTRGSSITTCNPGDTDTVCTSVDALAVIGGLCNGQSSCTVTPTDAALQHGSCSNPIKTLNVSYICGNTVNVCYNTQQTLTCSNNQKIKIYKAAYRYLPEATCSHTFTTSSCQSVDTLRQAHEICYGTESCILAARSTMFGDFCDVGDMDLEIFYQCVDVEVSATAVSCDAVGSTLRYSMLRAGCGDGIILRQDQGLTTNGRIITSPYFQSFRLYDTEAVSFECNFTVCYDSCDGTSCTKTARRRKRDLSDTSYEPEEIQQTEIKNSEGVQQDKIRNESKNGGSDTSKDMQQDKTNSNNNVKQDTSNGIRDESKNGGSDSHKDVEQDNTGSNNNVKKDTNNGIRDESKNGGSDSRKVVKQDKTGSDSVKQDTNKASDETDGVPDTKEGSHSRTGSLNDVDQDVNTKSEKVKDVNANKETKQENVDKSSEISAEEEDVNYPDPKVVSFRTKVFKFKSQQDQPNVRGMVELVRKNYKLNATNNHRNVNGQNNILTERKNRYDKMSSDHIITVYSKSEAGQDTSHQDDVTNEHVQKMETWEPSSDKKIKSSDINPIQEEEIIDDGERIKTHIYNTRFARQLQDKRTFLSVFYITCGLIVGVMMSIVICFIFRKRHNS